MDMVSMRKMPSPWQLGTIIMGLEPILREEQPGVLLVEGDTNSVLAGALTAQKMGIPVGHVEAGDPGITVIE